MAEEAAQIPLAEGLQEGERHLPEWVEVEMGARVLSVTHQLSVHTARVRLLTVYLEVIGRKRAESRWFVDSSMPGRLG